MVTWDVARAGGFTAFGLLTLSVAIGLALTLHIQSPRWPRIINSELHNFITLLALIFAGVHILAVWIDPFTHFGWNEVFVPFASHYRPLWMALGIVAFYIGIAIGMSTWLRPHIGYKLWRRLHVLALLLYALVVIHGIATGSDTRTEWGASIYASSVLLIGTLLIIRLLKPATKQNRAHPVLAGVVIVVIAIATFLCMLGPFQPGWSSIANNSANSGSSTTQFVPSQHAVSPQPTLPQPSHEDSQDN
jgi:predicted ferric reductase